MLWRKVTLIGVGLLGGSLGLALRKRGFANEVHGYVRRESSIAECLQVGAVDRASTDLAAAVGEADLIVFCTPLGQMTEMARAIAPFLRKDALLTDVGSVKGPVVADLEPILGAAGGCFVGSHPMAGSEKMGVLASKSDLFENAVCVVTPTVRSPEAKVSETEELWRRVGARVLKMPPELHDIAVSKTSHLPHVLAAQLATYVLQSTDHAETKLCASGFRDTTRIASGSPEMWRDIVLMNQTSVLAAIDQFSEQLREFRALLDAKDAKAIDAFFTQAKTLRDSWTSRCASPSPE